MIARLKSETLQQAVRRLTVGASRKGYKPAGLHAYHDADGNPWVYRIRLKRADGSKWIRPMRLDGSRFIFGEPPAPPNGKPLYRPPYPLVETDPVVIVEGETCADALAGLGMTVTTSGSADSANTADWTSLRGRSVLLWPDNDTAGTKYSNDVIVQLRALGCTVDVVDVDKLNLPDKGDCVDWLHEHLNATAANVLALPRLEINQANQPRGGVDVIEVALSKVNDDPGALFEPDVLFALREVRQSNHARYQRVRATAKAGKVSVGELDRLTMPACDGGNNDPFPVVEPWPDTVDGAALLDDIVAILHRHVIADKPTLIAAVLWAVHTWCMDALTVSPLAHITAPEKRCGKTVLLTALSRLVQRPLSTSNISPSALFRSMELWHPTLLIDEVDSFLRDNEEARGIINSGMNRENAYVLRSVGDDHVPTKFSTWGAKVLCGIGKLADTIEDRSILLRLRRKVAGEHVENIRRSDRAIWEALQSRMARWTTDNLHRIGGAHPAPIPGLNDRAQDCWEPLLAIADLAGGSWPQRARNSAVALHGIEEESPSIGAELLDDIKGVFEMKKVQRLASRDLLAALIEDDEAPWATWNRGKPLSLRQLAAKLKDFGISPILLRLDDVRKRGPARGYPLTAFDDAFRRYLSGDRPDASVTPLPASGGAGFSKFSSVTRRPGVTLEKPLKASNSKGCNGVTGKTTPREKKIPAKQR